MLLDRRINVRVSNYLLRDRQMYPFTRLVICWLDGARRRAPKCKESVFRVVRALHSPWLHRARESLEVLQIDRQTVLYFSLRMFVNATLHKSQ